MLFALELPLLAALFGLSAAAVAGAGIVLARSADAITHATGVGGLLIGMLLGAAASLPEIVTDVVSWPTRRTCQGRNSALFPTSNCC